MVGVRRLASVFILVTTVAMFSYVQSSHDSPKDSGPNKLLLILVDGFRWDYVDMFPSEMLPGFNRLRQTGVSANALIPVFPSHTLTNFYSIFTGNLLLSDDLSFVSSVTWNKPFSIYTQAYSTILATVIFNEVTGASRLLTLWWGTRRGRSIKWLKVS